MTTDNISILHYKLFTQFWSTCFEEIDINSIPYISLKCYAKDTAIQLMCLLLLLIWVGTTAFKSVYFQSNKRHPYTISITQGVTHVFRADHHNCLGNWNGSIIFYQIVQTSLKSIHFTHYQNKRAWKACQTRYKPCSGVPQPDSRGSLFMSFLGAEKRTVTSRGKNYFQKFI